MFVSNKTWREPLLVVLCGFQALLAVVAAVAAYWEVESILGTCSTMTLLGLVLAFFAVRRASLNLLLFGLWCPLVASGIAMLIALQDLNPEEAEGPVFMLLALNLPITVVWAIATAVLLQRVIPQPPAAKRRFRFRVMALLGLMTFVAVLLALLRGFDYERGLWGFWLFGIGVLTVALAFGVWFHYRAKAG